MDAAILEKIGLTKNESKVYVALLQTGTCTSSKILQQSGINSGKIYEILDALKSKGLVSETIVNKMKKFTASPPKQLLHYLEQKKEKLHEEESFIQKMVPQLNTIRNELLEEKKILVYTGFRGIITAAEEALDQTPRNAEILSMGISDINAKYQHYWIKWEKMRTNKKISARYILAQKGTIYKDLEGEKNIKLKVIKMNTPVGIDIYGKDKVLILHYQDPISCTLIYDENTATSFRALFEVIWNSKE